MGAVSARDGSDIFGRISQGQRAGTDLDGWEYFRKLGIDSAAAGASQYAPEQCLRCDRSLLEVDIDTRAMHRIDSLHTGYCSTCANEMMRPADPPSPEMLAQMQNALSSMGLPPLKEPNGE